MHYRKAGWCKLLHFIQFRWDRGKCIRKNSFARSHAPIIFSYQRASGSILSDPDSNVVLRGLLIFGENMFAVHSIEYYGILGASGSNCCPFFVCLALRAQKVEHFRAGHVLNGWLLLLA